MPLTASWGPFTLRLPFSPLSPLPPFISSMPELRAQLLATAGLLAALPPATAPRSLPLRVALPARGCSRLSGKKNTLLLAPCKGKTSFPGFTSGRHVSKAEGMKTAWLATLPSLWAPKKCQMGWSYLFQALGLRSSYHQGCLYFKRTQENMWFSIRMQKRCFISTGDTSPIAISSIHRDL